jgi:hypothetical protein
LSGTAVLLEQRTEQRRALHYWERRSLRYYMYSGIPRKVIPS